MIDMTIYDDDDDMIYMMIDMMIYDWYNNVNNFFFEKSE